MQTEMKKIDSYIKGEDNKLIEIRKSLIIFLLIVNNLKKFSWISREVRRARVIALETCSAGQDIGPYGAVSSLLLLGVHRV